MRLCQLFVIALGLCLPTELHAAVLERDLWEAGDGLLTYDTVNRREWLDLTETGGVQLATVLEWMAPGGKLEDFSFAMLEDVEQLAFSAGVDWMEPWMLPGSPGGESATLATMLGPVIHASGGFLGDMKLSFGQVASDVSEGLPTFDDTNLYVMCIGPHLEPGQTINPIFLPGSVGGIFASGPYSLEILDGPVLGVGDIGPFWLYREAVPEPSSGVLLVIGVLGIFWRREVHLV